MKGRNGGRFFWKCSFFLPRLAKRLFLHEASLAWVCAPAGSSRPPRGAARGQALRRGMSEGPGSRHGGEQQLEEPFASTHPVPRKKMSATSSAPQLQRVSEVGPLPGTPPSVQGSERGGERRSTDKVEPPEQPAAHAHTHTSRSASPSPSATAPAPAPASASASASASGTPSLVRPRPPSHLRRSSRSTGR